MEVTTSSPELDRSRATLTELLMSDQPLRAEDPPFPIDAAQLSMAWSGVHDNDPAEKWLRSRISQFMAAPLNIPAS